MIAAALYVPTGYYLETCLWRRRMRKQGRPTTMIDVRMFTVGPVQENCYVVRATERVRPPSIVDPGDEAERILEALARSRSTRSRRSC